MKRCVLILLLSYFSIFLYSEGSKQLIPHENGHCYLQINDKGRPFAQMSNTDSLHRLYIHVASTDETIYFGFQPHDKTLGRGSFRVKAPNGEIVYAETYVPVATGAGYIENYSEAAAGPKINGIPEDGYTPFSFSPDTIGDFYIEFSTTLANKYVFTLFDITVVNSDDEPIPGRLWSYAWDLNAMGQLNKVYSLFYIYTDDQYVSVVDMNGIQPYGFVISSNSTGTGNTGNGYIDRQSVEGNFTYPQYKVFLTLPDTTVYPIAEKPSMVEDLQVIGEPVFGEEVLFFINMDKAGTLEIYLDLDDELGYQIGGKDLVLVSQIKAGGDTIVWDGRNGEGDFVDGDVSVIVTSRFATGVTHLPIFDPEYHEDGFIVHRLLPDSMRAALYWDDSQLPNGTYEFSGTIEEGNGHSFPHVAGGYGDERTMNTWWNGYEINDLKSFSFIVGNYLPIQLVNWEVHNRGSYLQFYWITASEIQNYYFEIQYSLDGLFWEVISKIPGAGNSNSFIHYTEIYDAHINHLCYFRLCQYDYDGTSECSKIISPTLYNETMPIKVYSSKKAHEVIIEDPYFDFDDLRVFTLHGTEVTNSISIVSEKTDKIIVATNTLSLGTYIFRYKHETYYIYNN